MHDIDLFIDKFNAKDNFNKFIFENIPEMVHINDLTGNYIYSNKLDMIGYDHDELTK